MEIRLPRAQRRAQLIDVATEKFGERGFHPTSMDDIAEAAGITKPVLYQHFASKEDLYIAVITHIGAMLEAKIHEIGTDTSSTRERIQRGIAMFFELAEEHGSTFTLFFGRTFVSERVEAEVSKALSAAEATVSTVLLKTRHLDDIQAAIVGRALVGALQAVAQVAHEKSPQARQHALDTLATALTDGIHAFEPRSAVAVE